MSYSLVALLIGLLILVHELGHLAAARLVGFPVARFSVGFGPSLRAVHFGGTEYRLSAIPLGGYVLLGVENVQQMLEIPGWKRAVFFASGPLANFLFPVPLFAALNLLSEGFSLAGVTTTPVGQTWHILSQILAAFAGLGVHPEGVVGGIGLVVEGSSFVGLDVVRAIQFAIFMSLNLAVLNLLPIPVLDGGKIVLVWLERCFPRAHRLQLALALVGWILIAGVTVFVTAMDVARYWIT